MKAILAVTCVFSAVVLHFGTPPKKNVEAPHPTTQCAPDATLKTTYHFNNGTRKCEPEVGCANGGTGLPDRRRLQKTLSVRNIRIEWLILPATVGDQAPPHSGDDFSCSDLKTLPLQGT
uniref:Putative kun-6 n=1 Tax=Ixodes ricinus TaxID=34613 RepID=V5ICP0_IXORI